MRKPTPADVAAWTGSATTSAPLTAARGATLAIREVAFVGSQAAERHLAGITTSPA